MSELLAQLRPVLAGLPGDAIAFRSGHHSLRYNQLEAEIAQRLHWLRSLQARVVALYASNSIEWALLDLACQQGGITLLPLPTFFTDEQIRGCLQAASADLLLCDQDDRAMALADLFPDAGTPVGSPYCAALQARSRSAASPQMPVGTQKITFTSGSTGSPKGVCLSTRHQWQVAQALADRIALDRPRHLCLLPLSTLLENVAGIYAPLLRGGEVVIAPNTGLSGSSRLDVRQLLRTIEQTQPTSLILIPQLLTVLVAACQQGWAAPVSLRFIAVGGGAVAGRLIRQARQLGLPVYQGYGLSECGSVVALNTPADDHPDAVGRPLDHCAIHLEQDEIVVSGASHLGYLGERGSWYPAQVRTGDIGSLQGRRLQVSGRQKNILISSFGRNISPEWVESVLQSKPLLTHCVVMGEARPWLCALVSAPDAIDDQQLGQWIAACNQQLPDYARVVRWLRRPADELQRCYTDNGRPQRQHLQEHYRQPIESLYLTEAGTIA